MAHVADRNGPRRQSAAAARLAVAAALLSAGAGAIHAVVAGSHFEVYGPFGIAFAATAFLQCAWAVGVLVSPSRRLVGAGLVGNAGVVAAWALSRTAGLPLGPDAWTAEPVTLLDGAATAFEVAIVAACAALLVCAADVVPLSVRRFAFVAAVAATALTAVPIAVAGGGESHHHAHGHEAAAHAAHVHTAVRQAQMTVRPVERARPTKRAPARPAAGEHRHDHSSHEHAQP